MGEKVERTLVILKPDAMEKKVAGQIIIRIKKLGLAIKKTQRKKLSLGECQKLYPKTKENLPEIFKLVEQYLTENFSIFLIIEGEESVQKVRGIRGPTDLLQAPAGTVRYNFVTDEERDLFRQGKNVKNIMHASGTQEEAKLEIELFFDSDQKEAK